MDNMINTKEHMESGEEYRYAAMASSKFGKGNSYVVNYKVFLDITMSIMIKDLPAILETIQIMNKKDTDMNGMGY